MDPKRLQSPARDGRSFPDESEPRASAMRLSSLTGLWCWSLSIIPTLKTLGYCWSSPRDLNYVRDPMTHLNLSWLSLLPEPFLELVQHLLGRWRFAMIHCKQ